MDDTANWHTLGIKQGDEQLEEAQRIRERYACKRCGKIADSYMVEDSVWKDEAKLAHRDNACLKCLEHILGRHLTMQDFKDVPINNGIHFGYELRLREERNEREKA